jgi:hypothetical protein
VNFFNLFEAPSPQNGNVEDYLKKAEIAARSYIDQPNRNKIKSTLELLARKVSAYRAVRSENSWNSLKATLGDLAKLNVAPSSVLDIAGPAATDAYKTIRSSQAASDIDPQARSIRAGQGASREQSQADLNAAVQGVELPPGVKVYPDSAPITEPVLRLLNQKGFVQNLKDGLYDDVAVLGNLIFGMIVEKNWLKIFPKSFNAINNVHESAYRVAEQWIEHAKRGGTYEHINAHGIELWFPEATTIPALATKAIADVAQRFPEVEQYTTDVVQKESVNESINTHDKLVATVANYLYAKHPELFTKHGDGYVMSVVDDVVSKTEDLEDPLQDIKAFALEIMDALGADRTNEARAQVKTDWRGHHLVNADGAVVQTYPKDADNLEVARERLYRDHRRLNTMTQKNEDLDAAFDAALNTLNESVNINTTTSSEGDDTVTVTATGEDAYELVNILKAAGIPHDKAQQYAPAPCDAAIAMPVEEEYANEPEEDVMNGDMDHMNTQSGGLNRRKMQQKYANPLGDNPLAESEDLLRGLWDLYKEAK